MAKHFRWAYNRAAKTGQPREYAIASATAIEQGEVVTRASGLITAIGDQDQDDPYLGIAAEPHDGSTAGRQSGTLIKVYDSPDDIFAHTPSVVITATGGSTTTFVDSNLAGFATDNDLNGGMLKIVSCAADSSLNGRLVPISDYTASGGTITLGETLPAALAANDTALLVPGIQAIGNHAHDLNSDGTDIEWESSGGECMEIWDVDPSAFTVFFRLRQHLNSPHALAI